MFRVLGIYNFDFRVKQGDCREELQSRINGEKGEEILIIDCQHQQIAFLGLLFLLSLHISCRKNIMHETWVHSDLNGFDIKIMVKSIAIENIFKSWNLPANQHSQSSPILLINGWIGSAD